MKVAIITGLSGQDGTYLAELLITKNYRVIGAVRDIQKSGELLPESLKNSVELTSWDMLNQHRMIEVLEKYNPAEIYNFAAYSSGAGMFDDPVGIAEVNGVAVARILEAMRRVDTNIRFCQASSREVFGVATQSPQTEATLRNPRSPYGAAKAYAHHLVSVYRARGMWAGSAILYNHESPRRPSTFVTRKITMGVAAIARGEASTIELGNLDSRRDWGWAPDYMDAIVKMVSAERPNDYIIATGVTHSVREFVTEAFLRVGIDDPDRYIEINEKWNRPADGAIPRGDSSRIAKELGWRPTVGFSQVVSAMVEHDLSLLA